VILTTQYLEEADRLADDIVVLDHGRTVAHGTPEDLKSQIGDDRVDVTLRTPAEFDAVARATAHLASNPAGFDAAALVATVPVREGVRLIDVMRALDAAGLEPVDLDRREVTLDDVFLTLTAPGSQPEEATR
jgi:ABC-2 type transport system ATP-binding protein